MNRLVLVLWGAALTAPLAPTRLTAQAPAPWGPAGATRVLMLDLVRPSFDGLDLSFPSPMLYGGIRWPLNPAWGIVGEIPLALFAVQGQSATLLGNPYVGVDYAAVEGRGLMGGVGARLPLASESGDFGGFAQVVAAIGDFDRFEAWIEDQWALTGRVGWRTRTEGGLSAGFTIGGTFLSPKDSDQELLADYRADVGYRERRVAIGAEFTGRAILTEPDLDVGQRTVHQLTLGAGVGIGPVWPRAFVRIPLDADLKDSNFSMALGLAGSWMF